MRRGRFRIGVRNTRRVWAAVSAGIRGEKALMHATRLRRTTVYRALRELHAQGYIERQHGRVAVVVPLIINRHIRIIKRRSA